MKTFCTVLIACFVNTLVWAQSRPVRIVFDVTSGDSLVHQSAVRHAGEEAKAHPDGKFEIVIYSGALEMVLKDHSTVAPAVAKMLENKNASVKVCQATMKRHNIDKSQLLPGVDVVPDALVEIIDRQAEGWGYIKEAH